MKVVESGASCKVTVQRPFPHLQLIRSVKNIECGGG